MPRPGTPLAILLLAGAGVFIGAVRLPPGRGQEAPPAPSFARDVRPVLEAHCFRCHGPAKQRGKVDLSVFADEAAVRKQRKLWKRALEQVRTLQMPPPDQPALSAAERDLVVGWLEQALRVVDCNDPAQRDPGPPALRRLNRAEYTRTVRDLLGLDFDPDRVGMDDDPVANGFDNSAGALGVSPVLMEKYFAAAEQLLDRLVPPPPPDGARGKAPPRDAKERQAFEAVFFLRPGAWMPRRLAARRILERFGARAYRRPVAPAELDRWLALFDRAEARGLRFEDGVRFALKAILVSPHFLFRVERDRGPEGSAAPYRVDDYELASRLSYFLWSSMPDDTLFALAAERRLSEPAVLDAQVRRMLADPKAYALTENFAAQWLQLRKLAEARPSTEFFPTFTDAVRRAMYDETATFFDRLRTEDRSVLELLDADYTYLNEALAKHYGIAGVSGPQMRRVALQSGDHRGGLLGMGSMLAATSHTSRTSPTLRGKWILEVVFGTPPPPPPPDVGQIDEKGPGNKEKPQTFRELLARHATQASCAGCHNKMDPLGFALDNYDAVGRWRDAHGGRPLDVTGKLPGGATFRGPAELKRLIVARKDTFARNLTERLFVYALGRELRDEDECAVQAATAALARDGHRFSALVLGVARSYPMQYRRNRE